MATLEPQRLALHASARRTLGDDEGDTLMALLPPANTEIALRSDITHAETALRSDITRTEEKLRGDITRTEEKLRGEMHRLTSDLRLSLERRIHRAELRTIGAIVLTVLGSRFLG
jgi:hypothetical protein